MTDDNRFVVVRTATTPGEAKVLVAVLQAEGIQAHVDGDALADEIAVSRRAMNLNGVQVRVPARQLDEAKEILDAARVDESELLAQAMAAGPPPAAPAEPQAAAGRTSLLVAMVAVPAAIAFFCLWMDSAATVRAYGNYASRNGKTHAERTSDGWRWIDDTTKKATVTTVDSDNNGTPEITTWYDTAGHVLRIARDPDQDGVPDEVDEVQPDGTHLVWLCGADHRTARIEARDASGTVLKSQRFDGKNGFVDVR